MIRTKHMKKLILTAFILTVISLLPVKAQHSVSVRSCNPYPYAHFHPYRSQVVYSSQPVYVIPARTYAAPAVVYSSPVMYYPTYHCAPVYYAPTCHSSGLTIKVRF